MTDDLPVPDGPTRVLVTGSRDWLDSGAVGHALTFYRQQGHRLTVVHGDAARGADKMARDWCASVGDTVEEERHPAHWNHYGVRAGMVRNEIMVMTNPFVCLAFIMPCSSKTCRRKTPHGSHGATHCADLAESAGITTVRWTR